MKTNASIVSLILTVLFLVSCAEDSATPDDPSDDARRETAIVGRVAPPQSGMGVLAVRNGFEFASALTNDDGEYRITGLIEGEYNLIVSGQGFFTDTSVRGLSVGAMETVEAPPIEMRPFAAAATLFGRVVDSVFDEPLEGVGVTIRCNTGVCANLTAFTNDDGRYETAIWAGLAGEMLYQKAGYRLSRMDIPALPSGSVNEIPTVRLEKLEL
ncbi:MAG: carboxypeptidase-like regulatory domain-containing protein [Candidatus Poribacteria bacterium]|nr:carboxypeptidase-like regulatory domain-containing protein [Candidatus Poribacteria bacterium]